MRRRQQESVEVATSTFVGQPSASAGPAAIGRARSGKPHLEVSSAGRAVAGGHRIVTHRQSRTSSLHRSHHARWAWSCGSRSTSAVALDSRSLRSRSSKRACTLPSAIDA